MTAGSTSAGVLRQLTIVWSEFESRLLTVPIVDRVLNDRVRLDEYLTLMADHYHQVKEGGGWITRAASSITEPYLEHRTTFIRHAATEHLDYRMLERGYALAGGDYEALRRGRRNIGSEALNAWMYHRASQPNPFDLLGAMYIIEGLGKRFAGTFAEAVSRNLGRPEIVEFYAYHADHDSEHLDEMQQLLDSGLLAIPGLDTAMVRTARVTARLYLLQLEEVGHY